MLKFMMIGFALAVCLQGETIPPHECTHVEILGPLGPGLTYIDGSNPILAYHKNKDATYHTRLYQAGDQAIGDNYTYEHTFIGIGFLWNDSYFRGLSAMNVHGNAINFANPYDPIGEDDYFEREKAISLADDLEELIELVGPESWPNIVAVTGINQGDEIEAGQVRKDEFSPVTPENPFHMDGKASISEGREAFEETSNWFHGDPNLLEVRDVAYIMHRFNDGADFSVINVPVQNIMWCTAAETKESPFIPFELKDPYVHPSFADGSYYESANYSRSEIDSIEDAIMAPDGSVIGDVREIQRRIVEGWFNATSTCEEAGGQCCQNQCGSYEDCAPLEGTCSSGFCCQGTCAENGDINLDGLINEDDVHLCINVFLEVELNPDIVARADINDDGIVNTLDVQEIVNRKD
jgi:hypothetical protein